jgi:hypothetical protein
MWQQLFCSWVSSSREVRLGCMYQAYGMISLVTLWNIVIFLNPSSGCGMAGSCFVHERVQQLQGLLELVLDDPSLIRMVHLAA